jgi:polyphosphate kinase 2 (PPK2 family)
MDAAGKDSAIKHVMSGLNPQGTQVYSFKRPSDEELDHDYLWRSVKALPERGRIGIFNRSYYEEVLVVKVHPEILAGEKVPPSLVTPRIWAQRYEDINAFERYLSRNGTVIRKFFLHMSKEEQRRRLLERLDEPPKNWKFQPAIWTSAIDGTSTTRLRADAVADQHAPRAVVRRAGGSQMVRAACDRRYDR